MILADKIAELRKKNGWSQEELAGQLGVSRQSVSKWESAASIPDLDKILKLSELFGVSTDYLLKDSGEPEEEALPAVMPAGESMLGTEGSVRAVSLEEANEFLDTVWSMAPRIAAGVSMCILSPVLLILLACLADQEGGYVISEALAVAAGFTVLLVMVAVAVSLFLYCGRKTERFEYLEKEPIELAYGVTGVVEKRKKSYEPSHGLFLIIGIILCILSAIPLFAFGVLELGGMTGVYGFLLSVPFRSFWRKAIIPVKRKRLKRRMKPSIPYTGAWSRQFTLAGVFTPWTGSAPGSSGPARQFCSAPFWLSATRCGKINWLSCSPGSRKDHLLLN